MKAASREQEENDARKKKEGLEERSRRVGNVQIESDRRVFPGTRTAVVTPLIIYYHFLPCRPLVVVAVWNAMKMRKKKKKQKKERRRRKETLDVMLVAVDENACWLFIKKDARAQHTLRRVHKWEKVALRVAAPAHGGLTINYK